MFKKILYFLTMMLVVVSITSCSKTAPKDTDPLNGKASAEYSKKAGMLGIEAPTKTGKGNSIVSMLTKDSIGKPTVRTMPSSCISTDKKVIGKGKFLYENARGKGVKKPKYGVARVMSKKDAGYVAERQKWKPYGNCVACHNTANVEAPGDIGPDLTNYKANFIDTKVRTPQWVFAKISDPRVDNPHTVMSVNHVTFSPSEICAMMSFVFHNKS